MIPATDRRYRKAKRKQKSDGEKEKLRRATVLCPKQREAIRDHPKNP